jgi:Protein of unknown function (DUF3037)
MPDDNPVSTFQGRVLQYVPNVVRGEWVNIGVLLEETPAALASRTRLRRAVRVIESDTDFARIRRIHPDADERFLRSLEHQIDMEFGDTQDAAARYLQRLDQSLSLILQLSPPIAVFGENFDSALDRLFHDRVAAPRSARGGILENTRRWIRTRLNDVLRRHRVLEKMQHGVRVEEFTQPGDPFRIDYAYRYNGTRGYIQTVPLAAHPSQAKVLAYTAESIRKRQAHSQFAAITDAEPSRENPRHQFVVRLFEEQDIAVVPVQTADRFIESLRPRLQ